MKNYVLFRKSAGVYLKRVTGLGNLTTKVKEDAKYFYTKESADSYIKTCNLKGYTVAILD